MGRITVNLKAMNVVELAQYHANRERRRKLKKNLGFETYKQLDNYILYSKQGHRQGSLGEDQESILI